MAVRIICINKDNGNHTNPYEGITHFGWLNEKTQETGKATRAEMVDFIDNQNGQAYVRSGQNIAYCYTRQGRAGKFLETDADRTRTDNLWQLPECR